MSVVKKNNVIGVIIILTKKKEIEAVLNLIKRQASNQYGHMLPYFEE